MKKILNFILMTIVYIGLAAACSGSNPTTKANIPTLTIQSPTEEREETVGPVATHQGIILIPTDATQATIEFTAKSTDLGGADWLVDPTKSTEVDLEVNGIYALDKNMAILFGGIYIPAGTLQSTLLRTQDGGKHWIEVMPPVPGSAVWSVSFVDGGKGWALVIWQVEMLGPMVLYHSDDYGLTWQKLTSVPIQQLSQWPIKMEFSDEKNGQIDIMYEDSYPSTNRVGYLTTSDGGINWQETGSFPFTDKKTPLSTAQASYFLQHPKPDLNLSKDKDGGYWQLEQDWKLPYFFVTHTSQKIGGEVWKYALPRHLYYQQGKVLVP